EILQAVHREEGLAQVRGGDIDLVLLDMRLPPNTEAIDEGLRTVGEIHRLSARTLIIAMSGDSDRETMLRAAEAGVYDFFTKPLDIPELEIIVRRALERRHLQGELLRLREQLTPPHHLPHPNRHTPPPPTL